MDALLKSRRAKLVLARDVSDLMGALKELARARTVIRAVKLYRANPLDPGTIRSLNTAIADYDRFAPRTLDPPANPLSRPAIRR